MARYEVDLFQINCSTMAKGDSAIVLLVLKGLETPPIIGSIKSAVLIDFGNGNAQGPVIEKVIQDIKKKYTYDTSGGGDLEMNAVVVTHFDQDHMGGFNSWMSVQGKWSDGRYKHLRYQSAVAENGEKNFTPKTPLTKLYMQGPWPAIDGRRAIKGFMLSQEFVQCLTTEALLGTNMFTGSSLQGTTYDTITDLSKLVTNNNPFGKSWSDNGGAPGFYIVGANQVLLGNTEAISGVPFSDVKIEETQEDGLVGVIDKSHVTETNLNSLVMLVIWKNKDVNSSPKVSLYTGGDAEFQMENKVANFVNKEQIQVYKGGHHGSAAGTSSLFIQTVKPVHFIYSAGIDHGHPVPEVILYLDAWMSRNPIEDGGGEIVAKRLHATCYPYHLGWVYTDSTRKLKKPFRNELSDPDSLTVMNQSKDREDLSQEDQLYFDFVKWLLVQYKDIMPGKTDPITEFSQYINNYIGTYIAENGELPWKPRDGLLEEQAAIWKAFTAAKAAYLAPILTKMWKKWSKTTYDMYPESAFTKSKNPGQLIILDYVLATMSYHQTGADNYLQASVALYREGEEVEDLDTSAKAAKLSDEDDEEVNKDGGFTVTIDDSVKIEQTDVTQNATANVAPMEGDDVNMKRPQETSDDWALSIEDETYVLKVEISDDVEALMNEGLEPRRYKVVRRNIPAQTGLQGQLGLLTPTKIRSADGATGPNIINLTVGSNSNYFVSGLRANCLTLSKVQAQAPSSWTGQLDPNDSLQQWLQYYLSKPFSLVATGLDGSSVTPYDFTMRLTINMPATTGTASVEYDSAIATVKTAFNIASDVSSLIDDDGFLCQSTGLVLGLNQTPSVANVSFTLAQLYGLLEANPPLFLDSSVSLSFNPGADAINGLWISPDDNQSITYRLSLTGKTNSAFLVLKLPGFIFSNSTIIATKKSYLLESVDSNGSANTQMISSGSITILTMTQLDTNQTALQAVKWETILNISSTSVSLILRFPGTGTDIMTSLLAWLGSTNGPGIPIPADAWSQFGNTVEHLQINLRELYISAEYYGGGWHFSTFSVIFEVDLPWGTATADARVPVRMKFAYGVGQGGNSTLSFDGRLWTSSNTDFLKLVSSSPPYPPLSPSTPKPQEYFSLLSLLSPAQSDKFPKTVLPTAVTGLSLTIGTQGVSFSGTLMLDPALPAPTPGSTSWIVLDLVQISASYDFITLTFDFQASMFLYPRGYITAYNAELDVEISYDSSKGWVFAGGVSGVNLGCLCSLFPMDESDAVMNVLEQITLVDFEISLYSAPTNQDAKSFDAEGVIQLRDVTLTLSFSRNTAGTGANNWNFVASLTDNYTSGSMTVGQILAGVSPDIANILPDIVSQIDFAVPQGSQITLTCTKQASGVLFGLVVDVGSFEFGFAQVSSTPTAIDGNPPNIQAPKRLFKLALDHLDPIPNVPMLDEFTQPFDQIDFLWVSDDLTRQEVADLNAIVFKKREAQLVFTDPITTTSDPKIVKVPGTASPTDLVIMSGCHFQIVVEQNNSPTPVVDYSFVGKVTPPPPQVQGVAVQAVNAEDASNATANGSATGKWTATLGPLMISSIGLKLDQGYLYVMLDASVKLGPIAGNVKGFGIGIPLGKDMHSVDTSRDISVIFSGIGVEMDRPPVALAGELIKNVNGYEGGVVIEVKPYTFIAAGAYSDKVNDPTTVGKTFKSMFVIAELQGPIAELEFASLSGLTGGVGYNSQINLPTIDTVTTFPFLNTSDIPDIGNPANGPLSVLSGFLAAKPPWFVPADGPAWIAAGLTVKAFASLTMDTVVIVDLSEDIVFGIYADVTADFPAGTTNDAELFARIDMGFLAEINPAKGTFHAEGQLTPKSFILSQSCHLTGGFAVCYWFDGSGHTGDWVFTIGGYHSAFRPPKWYPVPPRLAINWQYDSSISIHGEAYFAITPKVCMGGGKLSLTYQAGSLSAYLDAYADFLINYKPFSFMADLGVNIGVRYTLDCWFVTKHFDVHFGATLSLHGPPLAGVAHVDWCIISFDIHFGAAPAPPPKLTWPRFYTLLLQLPDGTPPKTGDQINGQGMHVINPTSGVTSDGSSQGTSMLQNTGSGVLSVNKAIFSFNFSTLFPITSISYTGGDMVPLSTKSVPATFIKPMQIGQGSTVTSTLTVTITGQHSAARFTWSPLYKEVPVAVWGPYDKDSDQSAGPLQDKALTSVLDPIGATILQNMGIDFLAPEPTTSSDTLTFNIEKGSSYPASVATIPNNLDVPAKIGDPKTLDAAMNVWAPMTPDAPYAPWTVLGRVQSPKIAKSDIVNAWIKWNGINTDAPLGARLASLGASTGTAASWIAELGSAPTAPLPVLTAEASVKALMGGGTRFASYGGYRGTGAMLNRDWLDGGYIRVGG